MGHRPTGPTTPPAQALGRAGASRRGSSRRKAAEWRHGSLFLWSSRSHNSRAQPPKTRTTKTLKGAESPASEAAHTRVPAQRAGATGSTPAPGPGRPHLLCIIYFAYAFPQALVPCLHPGGAQSQAARSLALIIACLPNVTPGASLEVPAVPPVLPPHTPSASPTCGTAPKPQPGVQRAAQACMHTRVSASRAE